MKVEGSSATVVARLRRPVAWAFAALAMAMALWTWLEPPAFEHRTMESASAIRKSDTPMLQRTAGKDARSPHKPDAMDDVRTYAARRLETIKREPASWANVDAWRREFAVADSAELQLEVLGLAKQIGSEAFLAVLSDALASQDRLVRLDAVRSLAFLHENERVTGVTIAIAAADSEVREEVMEVIQQMPARMQTQLLRETLGSTYSDVQKRSVELLAERPSPAAFSVLIDGLRTSESGALALISEAIEGIVQQHFDNYAQANRWWATNRDRYDGMMLLAR